MIAAIYARKSTDQNGVPEEESVARQVERARAYAAAKGWTVAEEHIYVDDNRSGTDFATRPAFVRLMAALKPRPAFQVHRFHQHHRGRGVRRGPEDRPQRQARRVAGSDHQPHHCCAGGQLDLHARSAAFDPMSVRQHKVICDEEPRSGGVLCAHGDDSIGGGFDHVFERRRLESVDAEDDDRRQEDRGRREDRLVASNAR